MNRKLTKKEFKAIREVLGLTQTEYAELLNVSLPHISRTEHNGKTSYDVSEKLDRLVKEKLESMGMNIEEVLEVAKKGGLV